MLIFTIGCMGLLTSLTAAVGMIEKEEKEHFSLSAWEDFLKKSPVSALFSPSFEERKESFLVQKQMLITQYMLTHKVARLDLLSDHAIHELSRKIRQLFIDIILDYSVKDQHIHAFFADSVPLSKIDASIYHQIKYHVPASIKLAQAALETGYGKKVIGNNYFGMKAKNDKSNTQTTYEYYTEKEFESYKEKILDFERVKQNGKTIYKCRVRDNFVSYASAWESFVAHSEYLASHARYAPLFAKGKNYKAWAEKIGSTKYGGVGYATSPLYGQLLKNIIEKYHLYL
ncbi:MAG: glucosaminidase domain-containing protein, partial [Flammeovirgaceae bacterium]|nr:glucosaminidase domain-containing protein [Flammeovirgaceae bacterium]MDW8288343.1 glucosaminidase domain-containing protein [Flammeovirgaceae bacterium]